MARGPLTSVFSRIRRRLWPPRVDVGTYVDPPPAPIPPIEAQIEDGVLVALSAVRLAVTNRLILRSLRDGLDYDDARLRLAVTAEILSLAVEKEKDAQRVRTMATAAGRRPGVAADANDFRARDTATLERRATVSAGLAAKLADLSTDPQVVGEIATRAHEAALDEFEVSVARGARAVTASVATEPLTEFERLDELQTLSRDLDRLRRAAGG